MSMTVAQLSQKLEREGRLKKIRSSDPKEAYEYEEQFGDHSSLEFTALEPDTVEAIRRWIEQQGYKITRLKFIKCNLRSYSDFYRRLTILLNHPLCAVRELDLSGSYICWYDHAHELFYGNKSLIKVNLSETNITDEDIRRILRYSNFPLQIQELNLEGNHIKTAACIEHPLWIEPREKESALNTNLTQINLYRNPIAPNEAARIYTRKVLFNPPVQQPAPAPAAKSEEVKQARDKKALKEFSAESREYLALESFLKTIIQKYWDALMSNYPTLFSEYLTLRKNSKSCIAGVQKLGDRADTKLTTEVLKDFLAGSDWRADRAEMILMLVINSKTKFAALMPDDCMHRDTLRDFLVKFLEVRDCSVEQRQNDALVKVRYNFFMSMAWRVFPPVAGLSPFEAEKVEDGEKALVVHPQAPAALSSVERKEPAEEVQASTRATLKLRPAATKVQANAVESLTQELAAEKMPQRTRAKTPQRMSGISRLTPLVEEDREEDSEEALCMQTAPVRPHPVSAVVFHLHAQAALPLSERKEAAEVPVASILAALEKDRKAAEDDLAVATMALREAQAVLQAAAATEDQRAQARTMLTQATTALTVAEETICKVTQLMAQQAALKPKS